MSSTSDVMQTKEAAEYLRVAKQTLEGWRRKRTGPPFLKMGKAVRYRKADLDAWMDSRKRDGL